MLSCVLHGQKLMPDARSKVSSGTMLYRTVGQSFEVLLVHPAGNYNRRAPWGIPKGAPDPGEDLETTARRETREETGIDVTCTLVDLGFIDYTRSKKRVHAFAAHAPEGTAPRCASWEVDKAEFIEITRARRIIHPDQAGLLDRLQRHLGTERVDSTTERVDSTTERVDSTTERVDSTTPAPMQDCDDSTSDHDETDNTVPPESVEKTSA
jgi:predicted NUDIX family NTP pyrophosphohydrolase